MEVGIVHRIIVYIMNIFGQPNFNLFVGGCLSGVLNRLLGGKQQVRIVMKLLT